MISSPCKTCSNREFPKDLCLDACEKIQGMQDLLLEMPIQVYSAVDSAASDRYRLSLPHRIPMCE